MTIFVRACGVVDGTEIERWAQAWLRTAMPQPEEEMPQPEEESSPVPGAHWWSRSLVVAVMVVAVIVVVVVVPVAWSAWSSDACADGLAWRGAECVGVTDGTLDGHAEIFGPELEPVMRAIAAENRRVMDEGDNFVTVAYLGPLGKGPYSLLDGRDVHKLEGAFIGQVTANREQRSPRIRMVVANMGSDESAWRFAVDQLKARQARERIVAIAGVGLSQQESVDAARRLAAEPAIPIVGDTNTADGFDATGAVDGKGRIPGLVRVSLNGGAQMAAVRRELAKRPELTSAMLVQAENTPQGTPDLYTASLRASFRGPDLKPYLDKTGFEFLYDPRGGPGAAGTISDLVCAKSTDILFYAGRQAFLPVLLKNLRHRPCHSEPLTVVTGSQADGQDRDDPNLHAPEAPLDILHVPLADPGRLDDQDNPHRDLFEDFIDKFTRPHHGQRFPRAHVSGWTIVGHDAMVTATTAINKAGARTDSSPRLPTPAQVSNQLSLFQGPNVVRGAGGVFNIDPTTGNRINSRPSPEAVWLGGPR
ncbi:hypothetical protein [Actinomadura sp. 9N215]|uniref:hypothetical protein n=1 Tax=Actinomadura sp. 9N215 TaxID=3375150 RepID=UPI00379DB10E